MIDLCKSLDELSDQEKATEVLPITVQQLYVLRKLGKIEEAERIAPEVSLHEYKKSS
jgi:signal recognition particle subunit SRP72